jgi:hypothetical protein
MDPAVTRVAAHHRKVGVVAAVDTQARRAEVAHAEEAEVSKAGASRLGTRDAERAQKCLLAIRRLRKLQVEKKPSKE